MKNILSKLAKAKESIKNTKLQKKGENTFSHYKYFTPDQIEKLVSDVCMENDLLIKFDLIRNELGIYGQLSVFDVISGEVLEFKMASDIPMIKATNIAQQLGGAVTYTERYLKMSAFGIVDNSLDFDTTQNTKKTVAKPREVGVVNNKIAIAEMEECKSIDELAKVWSKYKGLQKDREFIDTKNAKKIQLS